jgi:hypothetical protein
MTLRAPISRSQDVALLQLVDEYIAADKEWRRRPTVPNKASWTIKQAQERKDRAALGVVDRLLSKIIRKRALTVVGVVGKAKVVMIEAADQKDFATELGVSMARDLLAIDGAKTPAARKRRKAA